MKFGLMYEIQIPEPKYPGVEKERYDQVLAQVDLADEIGFDCFWTVEHHFLAGFSHCSAPEVLDCAVLAVPSELGEDGVKAYVVPRPDAGIGPADWVYWCAEQLAYFKVPRYIEMWDDLPRTPSLRVRKDVLRQEQENPLEGCFDREAAGIKLR